MTHHEHTQTPCPGCGKQLDACFGVEHDQEPKPGDLTICAYCAKPLVFNQDLTVRCASPELLSKLDPALVARFDSARAIVVRAKRDPNAALRRAILDSLE
jgi:hypothetical protein